MISKIRAVIAIASFLIFTFALMPVQLFFVWIGSGFARSFPHWYHRQVCKIFGISLHIEGEVARDRPVLLVSNHVSWLDIPVLSAVAPLSFIAKKEVASWPFVSWLAKLQRTVFVDRERRTKVRHTNGAIAKRLSEGDTMVLFAEGTSSDGNQVLPFKSALFASVMTNSGMNEDVDIVHEPYVQTLAIGYTKQYGLPLGRRGRPNIAWYGDMEMADHIWTLIKRGPIEVRIKVGKPIALHEYECRKDLARLTESAVREDLLTLLYRRGKAVAA